MSKLRVLMLASYFPKPGNRLMGNWALSQAHAFERQDVDVQVVSFTSWVPRSLSFLPKAAAYSECPETYSWDSLKVHYPRIAWYPIGLPKRRAFRDPRFQMEIAWRGAERFLSNFTDKFAPDVIYAHHTAVNGFLAERLTRRFPAPYVITDHDFEELASCARFPGRKRFFEPIVSRSSKMVSVASRMATVTKEIFPHAPVLTIHNGTDPIPEELIAKPRPESLKDKLVLFSCGAFYERKGFPLLIEAFAKVRDRFPNAVLRIAGDGDQRHLVEQEIARLGVHDQVELLGFLPHAQVLQEMCWCDAFVLVGWDEPFATVFTEAMSAGKPVVCASDGGINDVMKNEVHGLSVLPKDVDSAAGALRRILADGALRLRLGKSAKERFESGLKWDHNARNMIEIFRQALAQKSA